MYMYLLFNDIVKTKNRMSLQKAYYKKLTLEFK